MKKNILIIGGTGFLGYHLSKFFKKGYFVTSLSKNRPQRRRRLKKIKYIYADISKQKELKILNKKKFHYVINCGGYVDHVNKQLTYKNHYLGCKNLINLLKNTDLKLFIQIGSSSEYGATRSPQSETTLGKAKTIYGKSKLAASKFLMSSKNNTFPFVILRFYQLFGPNQDSNRFIPFVIKSCLEDKKFPCSKCTQDRDFLYIDDAIKAVSKCLENIKNVKGKIINVGYGKPINLKKIINYITKKIGKGTPNYGEIKLRSDEINKLYPYLNNARVLLKWRPTITFEKGINKTIKYFKQNV